MPIAKKDPGSQDPPGVTRLSLDGKATVTTGAFSRGGTTRGEYQASDHACGGTEPDLPWGILDEAPAPLSVIFGSSATTSDFLVDTLRAWWHRLSVKAQRGIDRVPLTRDTGPERSGVRTQFLHRLVQLVDTIGNPLQLLYSPPSHSKDNPSERGWGMLE